MFAAYFVNKTSKLSQFRMLALLLMLCTTQWAQTQVPTPSFNKGLEADPSQARQKHLSTREQITAGGLLRTFLLYVPPNFRPGHSALLIALHGRGGGGPAAAMEAYTKLDDKADQAGFAIAYLDGLPDVTGAVNWNYFYDPFFVNGPDDVAFVRDVIDSLQTRLRTNKHRTYVTGTSAGGFMAQRVAVELSDRVAAVAVVQGGLFVDSSTSPSSVPNAVAPVSMLFIKGDQDPNNLYCGAIFPTFGVTESNADQDFDYWTGPAADQCAAVFPHEALCKSTGVADANGVVTPGQATKVVAKVALACRGNTEVEHYRLLGGTDQWNLQPLNIANKTPYNPDLNFFTGATTNDIIWRFFEEHPKGGLFY